MKKLSLDQWLDGGGNNADAVFDSCEDGFAFARERNRPIIAYLPSGDKHEPAGVYKFFPSGKLQVVAQ